MWPSDHVRPGSGVASSRSGAERRRVGYVVKVYPRFSETFIVSEILAREARGEIVDIFALRPPVDPRFHAELARVQAPVHYLTKPLKTSDAWELLRTATAGNDELAGRIARHLRELLAADPLDALQAVELARLSTGVGVRHLHAHFGSQSATVTRLASLLSGIPFSFTAHAKDIFHDDVDWPGLREKLRDAHHVVTISDYNLRFLRSAFPTETDRLHRVYNGIELRRFPYRDPAAPGRVLRIAATGRLVPKKGFTHLIDAVKALTDRGLHVELCIAGGGDLHDELQSQIDRLGVGDSVTLVGPQPQDRITALLTAADVFVAPCVVGADGNADGLPTVLLEAMALGVPCIATAVTGIPEVVRPGDTGILLAAGGEDALAEGLVEAIERVAEHDFPRVRMARSARALIEERFDSSKQAAALERLMREPAEPSRREPEAATTASGSPLTTRRERREVVA